MSTASVFLNAIGVSALILLALPVGAQRSRSPAHKCDRLHTTAFEFGRIGGSIKPTSLRLAADGTVSRLDSVAAAPTTASVAREAVTGLARLAWTGSFPRLPSAPHHPTRNPDAARDFIELTSPCGSKHVEYAGGEGAPAFRELFALLTALTR